MHDDDMRLPDYEEWETVDFRPASPGWRAAHLVDHPDGTIEVEVFPVPGWIIQYGGTRLTEGGWVDGDPRRRVVAAELEFGEAVEASALDFFWKVLAPDEPVPTEEDARGYLARRAQFNAGRRLQPVAGDTEAPRP